MKQYFIKSLDKKDFSLANTANIDIFMWCDGGYEPKTYAKVIFVEKNGFYVQMTCYEKNPKVVYKKFYAPVCRDSCVEFFFNFAPEKNTFVNFETNAAGTCLVGVGESRKKRRKIDEITGVVPTVQSQINDTFWQVEYFLPLCDMEKVFGKIDTSKGSKYLANFYKCGDKTEIEHYGMWAPISISKPDFHRPEYFNELIMN